MQNLLNFLESFQEVESVTVLGVFFEYWVFDLKNQWMQWRIFWAKILYHHSICKTLDNWHQEILKTILDMLNFVTVCIVRIFSQVFWLLNIYNIKFTILLILNV